VFKQIKEDEYYLVDDRYLNPKEPTLPAKLSLKDLYSKMESSPSIHDQPPITIVGCFDN
jgi:hypothetical protein